MFNSTRRGYSPAHQWVRFRFVSEQNGATRGFVLKASVFDRSSTTDLTKCFPLTDLAKSETLEVSPYFNNPEHAFSFRFDGEEWDA